MLPPNHVPKSQTPYLGARRAGKALVTFLLIGGGASALDAPLYLGPKPPANVRRVVTLAPSLSETVIALGAADRLVGVSRFDEFPEVSKLPRVGGFVEPSVEAVVSPQPELLPRRPSARNCPPAEKIC